MPFIELLYYNKKGAVYAKTNKNAEKVCHFPNVLEFLPADDNEKKTPIVLTIDEYETIRLLDKNGYSQEQCAAAMQIARTTVQRIYEIARKKIADALIDGHPLRIEGGDFRICDGQSSNCSFGGCYKQEIYKKYAEEKGEGIMNENVDGMMIRLVGLALAVLMMAGMTIYTDLFKKNIRHGCPRRCHQRTGRPCGRRGCSVERLR